MATTFPTLTPTSRSFTPPTFPTTKQKTINGITVRRVWASLPNDARLSLSFTNFPDADCLAILNAYTAAKGSLDSLTLPSSLFAGAGTALATFLTQAGTGLAWHFSDDNPPRLDNVAPGISSVTVELTATFDRA